MSSPETAQDKESEGDKIVSDKKAGSMLLAILIGAAGGALFAWAKLPLPWMMGAMVATTIAAVSGLQIRMEPRIRQSMVTILGVMLGSAFSPELLGRLSEWFISISGLLVYALTAGLAVTLYFRKVARFDPVTSYFASSPGGLNEMVIVGREFGGDDRVIALTHSARILLVVMIIPFLFRIFADLQPLPGMLPQGAPLSMPLQDWLYLGGCAVAGAALAKITGSRVFFLMGPMLFSAIVHIAELTHASPPGILVAAAQIALGTGIGCRFAGTNVWELLRIIRISIGSTIILLAAGVGFGVALEPLTGVPWFVLVLAYAPGGLAEMSLVALALDRDVAFVATHHIFRIAFIVVLAPLAFRLMRNMTGPKDG